jgi:hypothetical protein
MTSFVSAVTFKFCPEDDCAGNCDDHVCEDIGAYECCLVDASQFAAKSVQISNADIDVPVLSTFYASEPGELETGCDGDEEELDDTEGKLLQETVRDEAFYRCAMGQTRITRRTSRRLRSTHNLLPPWALVV